MLAQLSSPANHTPDLHRAAVGDVLTRSDDELPPHSVFDHNGTEWLVHERDTPQAWARGTRCLVLNSRECVRRVWNYPAHWRSMTADSLLRLGALD